MKRVLLFAAAALVLVLGWRLSGTTVGISRDETKTHSPEGELLAIDARPGGPAEALLDSSNEGRRRVELPKPRPIGWGSLVAEFTWERDSSPASGLVVMTSEQAWPPVDSVVRETDEAGTARFEALPAGRTALTLALGHSFSDIEVIAGEEKVVALTIPRTRVIRGRVIDAAGDPFPGAEIWGVQITSRCSTPAALTRSTSDGSFFLGDVGWSTYLSARSAGHRPSLSYFVGSSPPVPLAAAEILLQLGPPGGRVQGRVLDEHGQGVPKVEVRVGLRGAKRVAGPDGGPASESVGLSILTNELGQFRVPHDLAAGMQIVSAMAPGWEFWTGEVEVRTGETAELEICLVRASRVAGRVLDLTGEAAYGVRVAATHTREGFTPALPASGTPWTTTDRDGRFVLESMPFGRQPIQANARGPGQHGIARAWVECIPGQTHEVELTLDPGAVVRGILVDAQRAPLRNWNIRVEEVNEPANLSRAWATTDQEGHFLVANLDADSSYDIRVNGPDEQSMHPRACFRGLRPEATEHVFVVQNTSPATGQILGRVELDQAAEGALRVPSDLAVICRREDSGGHLYPELDRASGQFRIAGLTAGRYSIDLHRASVELTANGPYEVRADATVDAGVLSVPGVGGLRIGIPAIPDRELVGQRAELVEQLPDGSLRERDVDVPFVRSEGKFLSPPVPAGSWRLQFDLPGWFVRPLELRVESGQLLALELGAEPAIELQVDLELPAHLQRVDWYEISLRDPRSPTVEPGLWYSAENLDDEHRIESLCVAPLGEWVLEVRAADGLSGSLPLTVDELAAEQVWTIVLR